MDFKVPPPDDEEIHLSKLVFGDTSDFYKGLDNIDLQDASDEEAGWEYKGASENEDSDVDESKVDKLMDDQLFFVDDGAEEEGSKDTMDVDEGSRLIDSEEEGSTNESDAWSDSDDERLQVNINQLKRSKKLRKSYQESQMNGRDYVTRLRSQFEKIYPRPKWVDDVDTSDIDENGSDTDGSEVEDVINGDINALRNILQSTYSYKATDSKLLPVKNLDITRLKDANASHKPHSAIQSLSFHPTKPILLTGGYDRTLRIYHIDGKTNHLVSSVYLKGTPIQTCSFYVSPSKMDQTVFTGGRRRYMHSWDLLNNKANVAKIDKLSRMYGHEDTQRSFEKFKLAHFKYKNEDPHGLICLQGNNGWINILHARSGVWLQGCKIEGVISDFCIDYKPLNNNRFDTILIAVNTYGEVWEFNLNENGSVVRKWKDDGGVGITTIQVGGGTNSRNFMPGDGIIKNRWIAIGSDSGFVNVYDRLRDSPKPSYTLDQLTTTISSLEFSPDGQMLCMASRALKDALRLVHVVSGTVFSNWPTSGTPFGKVTSVAFSSHGEMLAVGNEQGKVRLWRLNHY